jgi:polysaccharide pyruvyl transferase WcaK-like protein
MPGGNIMSNRPKKIAFLGVFGSGNFGNDASLAAALQFVRRARPDAELACITPEPDATQAAFGLAGIPISWPGLGARWFQLLNRALLKFPSRIINFARAIRQIRRFDLMLVPGTGIFDDFGEGPWGMPFGIFRWCLAARLAGTKIALVSVGAGPIHHPISRWFMTSAMRMAAYRSYRDTYSRDYLKGIGFDSSADPVRPDLAFGLETPRPRAESIRPAIALGIMTYYGWENDPQAGAAVLDRYLAKIERFILARLAEGYDIRLLVGDVNDKTALHALMARLAAARPGIVGERVSAPPIGSLDDVMGIISRCDMVVATRFHNVVGALALGKPVISIGYAQKNDMLLQGMGLGDFCQHIERLDPDLLERQFSQLASGREDYARGVREGVALLRGELKAQEAVLTETFLADDGQASASPARPQSA